PDVALTIIGTSVANHAIGGDAGAKKAWRRQQPHRIGIGIRGRMKTIALHESRRVRLRFLFGAVFPLSPGVVVSARRPDYRIEAALEKSFAAALDSRRLRCG